MLFRQPASCKVNIDGTRRAGSRAKSRPPASAQTDPPPDRVGARSGTQRTSSLRKHGGWRTKAEGREAWLNNPGAFPSSVHLPRRAGPGSCSLSTTSPLLPSRPRRSQGDLSVPPASGTSFLLLLLLSLGTFSLKNKNSKDQERHDSAETRWPCLLGHWFRRGDMAGERRKGRPALRPTSAGR